MTKRGSNQFLLLFLRPGVRLGWRIAAAVALVALAFLAEGPGSVQTGARTALAQLLHQSAWRHALKDEPAQRPWPWEDVLVREPSAVPHLGLSAAVLREASGGADIAPAAPGQGPGAQAEPSRTQLGGVAIGDHITVTTADGLSRAYRVTGRQVVDPHLAEGDSVAPTGGEVSPVTCWPLDLVDGTLRLIIQATGVDLPKAPHRSAEQKL